jgi:hypothetical protein
VTRLFCLRQPDVVRYLQKSLPLPTSLQLDLTTLPGDHTREDVVDGILQQALTGSQGLPRTRETFETAMEEARGNLFEVAEQRTAQLLRIFEERHQTLKALEASLPPDTRQDIDLQWETLWAPGWCREPETIRRIPHYLKGIQIRVQRCLQNPGKDAQKQGGLEEPLNRLATALPSLSPHQIRIALGKLQEIRLQLFAPEIGSHEKISPKRFLCWLEEEMELGRRSQTK